MQEIKNMGERRETRRWGGGVKSIVRRPLRRIGWLPIDLLTAVMK